MANSTRRKKSKKSSPLSFLGGNRPLGQKILIALALLIILFFIGIGTYTATVVASAPDITEKDLLGAISSVILDENDEKVYELGGQKREVVDVERVPDVLYDAVISIEDRQFENHGGVDLKRIMGAAVANLRSGDISQGGSTITQQLVKLSVFSTDVSDRTVNRKLQEMKLARDVEKEYTKDEIFGFYINKVYLGNNIYGMGTAAEYYYGKPIETLELHEAALIAGVPNAPSAYEPYGNPENAQSRRDAVLYAMLDNGKITEEEYNQAVALPIETGLVDHTYDQADKDQLILDSFIQVVADDLAKEGYDLYTDGLTVHTTLDSETQDYLYDLVNNDLWGIFPDNEIQEAVTIIDTKTGQLKAISGGRKNEGAQAFNRATELNRSIASVMKPLSAYGPAIEYLNYSTGETITDEAYTYTGGTPIYNYDRSYQGDITMREALIDSRNIPALKTLQEVGADKSEEFLAGLNINLNDGAGVYESNAIGGEVTPLQLAASFAAFGNEGVYNDANSVRKIITQDGKEVEFQTESRQAMSDSTAYMITDMLKDVVTEGTGSRANVPGVPIAGKTGTTNYTDEEIERFGLASQSPDSWFAGYTTDYSIAIWTGYDNAKNSGGGLDYADQRIPSTLFRILTEYLTQNNIPADWEQPESVHQVSVVPGTKPLRISQNLHSGILELINDERYKEEFENTANNPRYQLGEITGLSASVSPDGSTLTLTWNPVSGNSVRYEINAAGENYETKDTSIEIPITVSVTTLYVVIQAKTANEASVPATLNIQIPERRAPKPETPSTDTEEEEKEEEEKDKEENTEDTADKETEKDQKENTEEQPAEENTEDTGPSTETPSEPENPTTPEADQTADQTPDTQNSPSQSRQQTNSTPSDSE